MGTSLKVKSRRYFLDIINRQDWRALAEILSDDFIFTLPTYPRPYLGREGFREFVKMLHSAFPDLYILPQEMIADVDNLVVTRWRGGGTHTGSPVSTVLGDLEANGRSFEVDGMSVHRYQDGRITEATGHEDTVGMMVQLGALPIPLSNVVVSSSDENTATVTRYFYEIMNQGLLEVIDEIIHPDFSFIIPTMSEPVRRRSGYREFVTYLRAAFPDIVFTPLTYAAEGNCVAVRWRINATHEGEFLGAPATHQRVEDFGVDFFTFYNGMIRTINVNENDFSLMQQIGLIESRRDVAQERELIVPPRSWRKIHV